MEDDEYEEWHNLCDAFRKAQEAVNEALGPVSQQYTAIEEEWIKFENAYKAEDSAKQKMKEFWANRRREENH